MLSIKKICLLAALTVAAVPLFVSAQTASTTTTAKLIADVNVMSANAAVADGTLTGSFTAQSSFGNQDNVVYGFVARSKSTGSILDTKKVEDTLSLPAGVPVQKSLSYVLPTYLAEAADVYLTLYTDRGVTLAVYKVGEVVQGKHVATCMVKNDSMTCTAPTDATLLLSVAAGSPQGNEIASESVTMTANKPSSVKLSDLTKDLAPGMYVVSGTVVRDGSTLAKVVYEYVKEGALAKIMSVSVVPVSGNVGAFNAIVYTHMQGFASTTQFALSANSPSCGEVAATPVAKGNVTELLLSTSCKGGNVTVTLLKDGNPADTITSTFSLPSAVPTTNNFMNNFLLIVLVALSLGIVVLLLKKHHGINAPAGTSTGTGAVAAVVLLFASLATFAPAPASAATVAISQSVETLFCSAGGSEGCTDAGGFYTSATIVYPSSVTANSSYTVSVSPKSASGSSSDAGCRDSSADGYTCDSSDSKVDLYINGSTWTSASHVTSGAYTRTAPASGSVTLLGKINMWAPYDFGCMSTYMSPVVKCGLVYDNTSNDTGNLTITVTAAPPTVDVHFSLLEKMFSAFALAR